MCLCLRVSTMSLKSPPEEHIPHVTSGLRGDKAGRKQEGDQESFACYLCVHT